jgi:DNA-binding GntR family transcriptional regulator
MRRDGELDCAGLQRRQTGRDSYGDDVTRELNVVGKVALAYEKIRAAIEAGELRPGQEISEAFLVDFVGLSRTPIRHALERLAGEGLVLTPARATPSVSRLSIKGARDLFEFRRMIEPVAAGLVARRAAHDTDVVQEFETFRDVFQVLSDAGENGNGAQVLLHTDSFDRAIADRIDNAYLSRQLTELRSHTARLRSIAHRTPGRNAQRLADHISMATLIAGCDESGSVEAMREHLDHVEDSVFESLFDAQTMSDFDL